MKSAANFFILLVLVPNIISVSFAANKEISGILTKATKNYIVVNNNKYLVTKKTLVIDIEQPRVKFPYSPMLFLRPCNVEIIVEKNVVKKILIRVLK